MITIDARWLNVSGIGTYLRNTLPGIIEAFPDRKICLLGETRSLAVLDGVESRNVRVIEARSPMYSLAEQLELVQKIPRETQLYFATHYNVPLLYRGKMLVTVYDLFHLAMPHLVGGWHKRLYARTMFNSVRRHAAAIITISQFTKNELIRLTGEGKQPIIPIHLGVASPWFQITRGTRPRRSEYILYVGNVKPHKNLAALVKAFGLVSDRISHDLVIVGKKEGFITGDKLVDQEAQKWGGRIKFTGYVDENQLFQYFAHAAVLAFPSLYEGFGLPPLEAMAAGCPVLASTAGPMPEVCGDAALYCDPHRPEDMAAKLLELLGNQQLREALRLRGHDRAREFTWGKCVKQTCSVINDLIGGSQGDVHES